jgi:hypothetical protein
MSGVAIPSSVCEGASAVARHAMRILTALVVGLGILIVAAAGLLAYGVFTRTKAPATAQGPGGIGFDTLKLGLPEGCVIRSVVAVGETIVIHAQNPNTTAACDRVFVVQATSGRVLGTIVPGTRP